MNVVDVFARAVRRRPDATFVRDRQSALSYAECDERSQRVAAALSEGGIQPGSVVALCAPDSAELLTTIIAVWKLGALPAMIDARTRDADLAYFVGDVGASVHVAASDQIDRLRTAGADEIIELGTATSTDRPPSERHTDTSPIMLTYTSGSTGGPKGCVLASHPVSIGTACIAERLNLTADDVLLATTPTASSFQLVSAMLPAMHVGCEIALAAGLPTNAMWQQADVCEASVLIAYPLTLGDVVNHPDARPGRFRLALSGGSPLAPRLKRDYFKRLGVPLVESYGQSEFGGFMALGSPADTAFDGFVGRPLPDRPAYVGDDDLIEMPHGKVGEVLVAEGYFSGYRNKPEAESLTLRGGMLHCGDVAVVDPTGRIKVLGRVGEVGRARRRGGFIRSVEDALYDHPSVKHAVVVETPSDFAIHAFVELLEGEVDSAELVEFVAARIPPTLRPQSITVVEAMPRTFSGKADRMALAATAAGSS